MFWALYSILGLGVALAAAFEGDKWYHCVSGGLLWPLVLARILYIRLFNPPL